MAYIKRALEGDRLLIAWQAPDGGRRAAALAREEAEAALALINGAGPVPLVAVLQAATNALHHPPATLRRYRSILDRYIAPSTLADHDPRELSAPVIRRWLRELESLGRESPVEVLRMLRVLTGQLTRLGWLDRLPLDWGGVRAPSPKRGSTGREAIHLTPLDVADLTAIVAAARARYGDDTAAIIALVVGGLSVVEVLGLQCADADEALATGRLPIRRRVDDRARGADGGFRVDDVDGGHVMVGSTICAVLSDLRQRHADGWLAGAFVFARRDGRPLGRSAVLERLRQSGVDAAATATNAGAQARRQRVTEGCLHLTASKWAHHTGATTLEIAAHLRVTHGQLLRRFGTWLDGMST